MSTREAKADRGRRRGRELADHVMSQLRDARVSAGLSQAQIARSLGWSQQNYSKFELRRLDDVSIIDIAAASALLGLEPALSLHRAGPALRDKGHEALIGRLLRLLAPAWHVAREVPFPNPGDPRWWDLLLRLPDFRLGVEAETRIRDMQAQIRRMKERAMEGGADALLLILSDSAHNRRLVDDLRQGLGEAFGARPADLLQALRAGERLPGSGVVLL
jgi:transcriptional regulator with XRE-family HTH domain